MKPLADLDLATVTGGHHAILAARGLIAWYGNAVSTVAKMYASPLEAPATALTGYAKGWGIASKTVRRLATEGHPDVQDFARATKWELGQIAKGKPF